MSTTSILIVDSDFEHATSNKKMLENAGYDVTVAETGKKGLEIARTSKPQLVILDAMLPDINGFSVCQELKNDPKLSSIRVIILTALGISGESYLSKMAEEHKSDAFFAKPVDAKILLSQIGELLTKTTPVTGASKVKGRILLVDDDPDFLEATRQILVANRYEVITAENGEDGIAKAKYESPNLILLDVIMPGKDGYSVCHELRKIDQTRPIPVIMLTAVGQQLSKPEYAVDMAIDHLADDFIDKPVDSQTLIRKIEKHLRH
jgi:DNA-binding response OmpR family regulator